MKEKIIFGEQSIRKVRKVQYQYNFWHMVVHILLLKFYVNKNPTDATVCRYLLTAKATLHLMCG